MVVPKTSGLVLVVKVADVAVTAPLFIDTLLIVLVVEAVMVPARVSEPPEVRVFAPVKKLMLPVFVSPRVSVWRLVVASVPAPERYAPPVDPESVATGAFVETPVTANLADEVVVPPIARSSVELIGKTSP